MLTRPYLFLAKPVPKLSFLGRQHLVSSAGDEEPLVDGWIDWCWGELLVGWDMCELGWADARWRVLDLGVDEGDISWGGAAGDELFPGLSALTDNISGVPSSFVSDYSRRLLRDKLTSCSCTRR